MKKYLSHFALIIATAVCLVAASSCDDDDYVYSDDFLSRYDWELVAVNGMNISEADVVEFEFYSYGNGTYGRYDAYGSWYTIPIQWEITGTGAGAEYLTIYPADGQQWDYLMRTYGGRYPQLELTDLATGDVLTFEPI